MSNSHYVAGQWNVICDVCGFKFKSSEVRKRWDNLYVCKDDYEHDHPQKFLRVKEGPIAPPFVRPQAATDTFVTSCDLWTSSPMADFGTADCATVGGNTDINFLINLFDPTCIASIAIASRSIPGVI